MKKFPNHLFRTRNEYKPRTHQRGDSKHVKLVGEYWQTRRSGEKKGTRYRAKIYVASLGW